MFVSSLDELTAFTVDLLLLIYLVVGLAALASRFVRRDVEHHYRMPLWPVTPLVAVAGAAYTLYTTLATATKPTDLIIIAGLLVAALVMYVVWRATAKLSARSERGIESLPYRIIETPKHRNTEPLKDGRNCIMRTRDLGIRIGPARRAASTRSRTFRACGSDIAR